MPSFDQIEIVHPSGEIQFFDLDPATGIVNIGRHPDNDVILGGHTVRPFHALIDHRQRPYQVLMLDEQGSSAAAQPLTVWQTLQIGDYELVLLQANQREVAPPAQPVRQPSPSRPATPRGHPTPAPSRSQSTQAEWQIQVGQTLTHSLTINNNGDRAATFAVEIQGVPPEWVRLSARTLHLQSQEQGQVQVALTPSAGAGTYPLRWQITSPAYPGWQQAETVSIVVVSAQPVTWGRLTPDVIRPRFFRHSGVGQLVLTNQGSQPVEYALHGRDLRGESHVRFRSKGNQRIYNRSQGRDQAGQILQLLPGEPTPIDVIITPDERRWLGVTSHQSRVLIQGSAPTGGSPQSQTVTFERRPLINVGYLLVVAMLLLLAGLYVYRDAVGSWVAGLLYAPMPSLSDQAMGLSADDPFAHAPVPSPVPPALGGRTAEVRPDERGYVEIFQEIGQRYNVDWRILAALAYRESGLNPQARGGSGEYGLMQVLPATWNEWAPLVQVSNPWDVYSNVLVGAAYLSYLQTSLAEMGQPDVRWALAAYNWGPDRVATLLDRQGSWYDIPVPQRQYVADILMGVEAAPARLEAVDAAHLP